MYILLEHFKLYKKDGLKEPLIVKDATKAYQTDMDNIQPFIDEYLQKSPDETSLIKLKTIWDLYKSSNSYDKSMKMKELKSQLIKKLGVKCSPPTADKRTQQHFKGWIERPPPPSEKQPPSVVQTPLFSLSNGH